MSGLSRAGQCTLGLTRDPRIAVAPHWGSTCRRVSTSGGTWGQEGGGKAEKGRPQKQLLVEGAHDTGLGHRSGEGAEVRLSGSGGEGPSSERASGLKSEAGHSFLLFEGDT